MDSIRLNVTAPVASARSAAASTRATGYCCPQANKAQARTVAHLVVRIGFHGASYCLCRVRSDGLRPLDNAGGRPVQMGAVGLGTMFRIGDRRVGFVGARVGSDPLALVEDLDDVRRGPHFYLLRLVASSRPQQALLYLGH
jgi:hypothetical protein